MSRYLAGALLLASVVVDAGCLVRTQPGGGFAPTRGTAAGSTAPAPGSSGAAAAPSAPAKEPVACADSADRDFTDRFDNAVPLEPTSTTIACRNGNDVDMFTVTVGDRPGGALVRFEVGGLGGDHVAPFVNVFDANRKQLAATMASSDEQSQGWITVASGTQLFFKITAHGMGEVPYRIALQEAPLLETSEPNDAPAQATALPEAGTVQAYTLKLANTPASLDDWWRIESTKAGPLSIQVAPAQDVALVTEIFDANQKRIERKSGDKSERYTVTTKLDKGTYFVKLTPIYTVEPGRGGAELPDRVSTPYTLTTSR